MKFKYININKEEKIIDLPVSEEIFNKTKSFVKGSRLIDMYYSWLIWDLRDYFFEKMILDSFRKEINSFCKRILLADFDYEKHASSKDVKVVQMYYHVYIWDQVFIACEPEGSFHKESLVKDRLELKLDFELEELEYLLEQLLNEFEVDYSEFKKKEDISTNELEIDFLVENLLRECWRKTKEEANSKIVGTLFEATGLGSTGDLDTDEVIGDSEELIIEFFKKRNIKA